VKLAGVPGVRLDGSNVGEICGREFLGEFRNTADVVCCSSRRIRGDVAEVLGCRFSYLAWRIGRTVLIWQPHMGIARYSSDAPNAACSLKAKHSRALEFPHLDMRAELEVWVLVTRGCRVGSLIE
jgi:hypothetical protein